MECHFVPSFEFEVRVDGLIFETFDNREEAVAYAMSDCDGEAFSGETITVNRVSYDDGEFIVLVGECD